MARSRNWLECSYLFTWLLKARQDTRRKGISAHGMSRKKQGQPYTRRLEGRLGSNGIQGTSETSYCLIVLRNPVGLAGTALCCHPSHLPLQSVCLAFLCLLLPYRICHSPQQRSMDESLPGGDGGLGRYHWQASVWLIWNFSDCALYPTFSFTHRPLSPTRLQTS